MPDRDRDDFAFTDSGCLLFISGILIGSAWTFQSAHTTWRLVLAALGAFVFVAAKVLRRVEVYRDEPDPLTRRLDGDNKGDRHAQRYRHQEPEADRTDGCGGDPNYHRADGPTRG